MEIADFNVYEQNQRIYGGTAGRKMGISYKGERLYFEVSGQSKGAGKRLTLF